MSTLYDVLGVSRQTSAVQIKQGYEAALASLSTDSEESQYDKDLIRARAIREAYSILSNPARRANYDEKLRIKEQPLNYDVVEKAPFPWISIAIISVILLGGIGYYKLQAHRADVARLALETAKARMAAEAAADLARAERARLAQLVLADQARAEANRERESEIARQHGQQIHSEMQYAEAQAKRDKEQAERQAWSERQREDQLAQQRLRNQQQAMQRALNIPVR